MSEMQQEENVTLKKHVADFNTENQSLKKFVKVLEQDLEKQDELEDELERLKTMYSKEKDLNQQLLNTAEQTDGDEEDKNDENDSSEDTGEEGEENSGPTPVAPLKQKKVSSGQAEQVFRQKYEAEQKLNLDLQDQVRDLKTDLNECEGEIDDHIAEKEKLAQQLRDEQNFNIDLQKKLDAYKQEINTLSSKLGDTEMEKSTLKN